jgi:hypothetical protein
MPAPTKTRGIACCRPTSPAHCALGRGHGLAPVHRRDLGFEPVAELMAPVTDSLYTVMQRRAR